MSQPASALDAGASAASSRHWRMLAGRRVWPLDPAIVLGVCLWFALASRFIGLDVAVTADEGYWMQRTVRFGAALARGDLESTYRRGHPGVTVMWVGVLGIGPARLQPFLPEAYTNYVVLETAPGYREAFWWARYAMAVATSLLLTTAIGLAWKLLGSGPGLAGGLLLLLDPYVVGMSRLLHVDALLAPLMTVSALAALVFWLRGRPARYLALSAVAAGLALLTKAPAAFLVGWMGLLALSYGRPWSGLLAGRRRRPSAGAWRWLVPTVAWGALAAGTYVLFWPAMWVDPLLQLRRVAQFALSTGLSPHPEGTFFLGRAVSGDPGPLYYPVALAFRLGPVALAGLVAALVALARRPRPAPLVWLLVYSLLFGIFMTLGAKKFDRYLLPAIWMLDLLAGAGLGIMAGKLGRPRLAVAALAVLLGAQAVLLWRAYPYPIAFYNPLLGGTAAAQRTLFVGWGEGLEQVVEYLNARPNADRLLVATNYNHAFRPRFRGVTAPMRPYLSTRSNAPQPPTPNYFVIYVNSAQRRSYPVEARSLIGSARPEFVAVIDGRPYAWVYAVPWAPDYSQTAPTTAPDAEDEEDE